MPDTALADGANPTSSFWEANVRQQVVTQCTSVTRPTSPVHGRRIFETDTNRTLVYNGTSWVVVDSPWAAYTPSVSGLTLGNGTLNFRYRYAGWKTVHVRGTFTMGSTSAVTGLIGFGYPDGVTPTTTPRSIGHVWHIDNTGADTIGTCQSASSIFCYTTTVAGTATGSPFVWAVDDTLSVDIICEIA